MFSPFPFQLDLCGARGDAAYLVSVGIADEVCRGVYEAEGGELESILMNL